MIMGSILSNLILAYSQNIIIWTVFHLVIMGSSVVGPILSSKFGRFNFIYLWLIFGVFSSLLPVLIKNFAVVQVLIIAILLGISVGLGMPSCLAYFADCISIENRGITAGTILLITNLTGPLFAISFRTFNLIINSIIFAMWKGSGLIVFFLKPEEKFASEMKRSISFKEIPYDKSFVLYFTAWFMFAIIDCFERPVVGKFFGEFYHLMGPIIGSFSAFIAGLLSDRIGRKRVVLYGFVTIGMAYAIIGIAPATLFSQYFFIVVESTAIGILWVIFILILWGDLSQFGTREKYYAMGGIPFFLTQITYRILTPYVMLIPETSAFSLASLFLFIAVLPLLYAPETLPERKIELRRLRKYVEKAKKLQQRYMST
jgi:MFS family permease